MVSILIKFLRFLVMACTDVAMIPALTVMKKNRRHFELFIGIFHLFISVCFNVSEALEVHFFLEELEWHFISDILSVTYFLLLCVHLMGLPHEDINHILRYLAFALAWLTKTKDHWDSQLFEALLIGSYVIGVIYRNLAPSPTKSPIHWHHVKLMGLCTLISIVAFIIMETILVTYDPIRLSSGIIHVAGGFAFYHGWLAVPCRDTKKNDDHIPTFTSSYL